MKRQWMPLYVDDYLADTRRLSTLEHGAYILLIMEYWHHGSLPQDPSLLARIAGLTIAEWQSIELNVAALFLPGWKHKRIEKELAEAQAAYERRAAAGQKGGSAKAARQLDESIAPSNAKAMPKQEDEALLPQAQPLSQLSSLRSDSSTARADEIDLRKAIWAELVKAGTVAQLDPSVSVMRWLKAGYDPDICLGIVRELLAKNSQPRSMKYFEQAVADAHAMPEGVPRNNGPPAKSGNVYVRQLQKIHTELSNERPHHHDIEILPASSAAR